MRSIYTEAFNIARTNDTWIDDGFVRGEKLSRDMQHGQEIKSEVRPSNQGISGLATLKTLSLAGNAILILKECLVSCHDVLYSL